MDPENNNEFPRERANRDSDQQKDQGMSSKAEHNRDDKSTSSDMNLDDDLDLEDETI